MKKNIQFKKLICNIKNNFRLKTFLINYQNTNHKRHVKDCTLKYLLSICIKLQIYKVAIFSPR